MSLFLAFANVVPSVFNVINSGFTLAKTQCKKTWGIKGGGGGVCVTGSHKLSEAGKGRDTVEPGPE